MPSSFRSINYVLRPAKHVERKMLRDAFRRLVSFGPLETYRYIGFGSIYFGDFQLFHKSLGISDMISMERSGNEARVNFNRPYRSIDLKFGDSEYLLRNLPAWEQKTILWLDYDGPLNRSARNDIDTFCSRAVPGSVLVVTVNADPGRVQADDSLLDQLIRLVDSDDQIASKVPATIRSANLAGWGLSQVSRRIIVNQIKETLANRGGGQEPSKRPQYQQLFHFRYADGARMMTTGGVLYTEEQRAALDTCEFRLLPFVRLNEDDDDAFQIVVPQLTYRELHYLDKQLPLLSETELEAEGIPKGDLANYAKIYQYHATFAETEV